MASSAALLRRVGFMILMIVIPVLALISRRSLVVLMPVALILIIIASLIDGAQRPIGAGQPRFRGFATRSSRRWFS